MRRLILARMFLLKPRMLLADEPASADRRPLARDEISITIIFITHDKFVGHGTAADVILRPTAACNKRPISDAPDIYEPRGLTMV